MVDDETILIAVCFADIKKLSLISAAYYELTLVASVWFPSFTVLLRGDTLNYRSGIAAKGFLWMLFCHTLFCSILCR